MSNEMSKTFQQAYGASQYDNSFAVKLYDEEVIKNPDNYAAFNNRGVCKIRMAIEKADVQLAEDGKNDCSKAVSLAKEVGIKYHIAQDNIIWADEFIISIRK
jgi:hypothetical protein